MARRVDSSRWVFFSQTMMRRGFPSSPLTLVHAHFDTSRWENPPVHRDFDAARWGNPSTILVHLDFDARRWGTHSTIPVHLLFNARRWGTPPRLSFSHVSMPGGWEMACPLSAICCLPFEQVMGGFPFSSALCRDLSSI